MHDMICLGGEHALAVVRDITENDAVSFTGAILCGLKGTFVVLAFHSHSRRYDQNYAP